MPYWHDLYANKALNGDLIVPQPFIVLMVRPLYQYNTGRMRVLDWP